MSLIFTGTGLWKPLSIQVRKEQRSLARNGTLTAPSRLLPGHDLERVYADTTPLAVRHEIAEA
jgi:hypothetical protein